MEKTALKLRFKVSLADDMMSEAQEFYKSCGRTPILDPKDIIVFGFAGEQLVGIVRLCFEQGIYVLRSMQIQEAFQKKGYGKQVLEKFKKLLAEQAIAEVYCIPYSHLEGFYSHIDFKKIDKPDAPLFLQERMAEYYKKNPGQQFLIMRRTVLTP